MSNNQISLPAWLHWVSFGGVASLGVSAVLFQVARMHDGRAAELGQAMPLESLADALRLDSLPMLVAVRGRVTCREPSKCELGGGLAVMRELVEEEVYFKEHPSGRVTQECFETRREQEAREAHLEDRTGWLKLENLANAAGLPGVMESRQVFRPVDPAQGGVMAQVFTGISRALKSMVKHGVRSTERFLPVNTTVTVVGELVHDAVGTHLLGQITNGPSTSNDQPSTSSGSGSKGGAGGGGSKGSTGRDKAAAERRGSGDGASTSGRPAGSGSGSGSGASSIAAGALSSVAAVGAADLIEQAASAAVQALPYTLRMPAHGPYQVTTLTLPQLRASLHNTSRTLRFFAWSFGLLGAALAARKVAQQLWRLRERRRVKRLLAEAQAARRQRQAAAAEAGSGREGGAAAAGEGGAAGGGGAEEGLRAPGTCVVCFDRDAEFVYTRCGHLCVCEECMARVGEVCPMCRASSRFIRVFRP
ncbi:hypothetical protein HYH03_002920 [Edaphochlamys debaryana]|uniref:RING-type E3 ubiquitin transferase n=1 Tax=Edaphochlamys debaryana TaxID=47281 RepID=A0A836C3Z8_9CHLO|nr:hypothetical protein HYH03_002920 [Edaphochlamys debaryana]|eukprot:KAG2499345.1 hypothetical protein HYH03_002920 [Edaphochlamys debaryana]